MHGVGTPYLLALWLGEHSTARTSIT